MNIGQAVEELKKGGIVRRSGWNGKTQTLQLSMENFRMAPFVVIYPENGLPVPWLCSQSDLLAQDWEVVEGP